MELSIFRNHIYVKLQVVRNVIRIPVHCVNMSRRSTGLTFMHTNDIKATVIITEEEIAEAVAVGVVVVEVEMVQVPMMRRHIEAMKCR